MDNQPVVIIGGGITGLSAAWYLEKKGCKNIILLEASDRVGGKIETRHENGFLVESGPDSFIITKPDALDLIKDLGLEADLVEPKTNQFYIMNGGKLMDLPKGLNMMVPTDEDAFQSSDFFSADAKKRIAQEAEIPARESDTDESFGSFIERRFGKDMLDLYASPLFTGIYATPADELSMNATFPMFQKMEKDNGSITAAVAKMPKPNGIAARSTFLGLKNGISSLTQALVSQLKHTQIILNAPVKTISVNTASDFEDQGSWKAEMPVYKIELDNITSYYTQNLIISTPSPVAASLISPFSEEIAAILLGFSSSSSRIVTLAYNKADVTGDLNATGYVSAANENTYVSAGTWLSSKWDGRSGEDFVLLRCFMGKKEEILKFTDSQLVEAAHAEMSKLLGITSEPAYHWVQRWENALPQYKIGHVEKVKSLKDKLSELPGLQLAGSYIAGVGLPDCIRQGREAANAVAI